MPRRPDGNPATSGLRRSVFSHLVDRLKGRSGPVYPLHVGDTYLSPPPGARVEDQLEAVEPRIHRYENPRGWSRLIETIVEARRRREDPQPVTAQQVVVTTGATGGLSTALQALLVAGQELLILAPHWPLIRGMAVSHGLSIRQIPFYDRVRTAQQAQNALESAVSRKTAAVYVNWPNNPSGVVSSPEVVGAVVRFACRHDLWILSDEVYEDFSYGPSLVAPTAFPEARDRTLRVHSFSKAYALAGNRVGYVLGPPEAVKRIEQLATYLVYSVNTAGQRAAETALRTGDAWLERARSIYEETGRKAAQRLGLEPPDGGTFLLVDVRHHLDERGLLGFLEDCLEGGLLLAPGEIFGPDYAGFIRLCFTSAEPDTVMAGVEVLAGRMGV